MPSLKFLARRFSDRAFGTEFERTLARARGDSRRGFLFFWNRGLGDIALGLVPLFLRIRKEFPRARIEVVTREELRAPFELAGVDAVYVVPGLQREARIDLERHPPPGVEIARYAAVFAYPDPNRWLVGRRRDHPPVLPWNPRWDVLVSRFRAVAAGRIVIGAHVHSETAGYYGYVKDWPAASWQSLVGRFDEASGVQWLLFGHSAQFPLEAPNVVDLRGRTSFAELMALIKNRCRVLIAPDSGVLTMAYYLDAPFEIDVISLWADPRQGILLQDCASPNPKLRHVALQSPQEDIRQLSVETVEAALREAMRPT